MRLRAEAESRGGECARRDRGRSDVNQTTKIERSFGNDGQKSNGRLIGGGAKAGRKEEERKNAREERAD